MDFATEAALRLQTTSFADKLCFGCEHANFRSRGKQAKAILGKHDRLGVPETWIYAGQGHTVDV